ncbi:MAG: protoheme IX farnesyltransferase [Candidatus Omnitrophica bacterium]|nr:protoheme IX farnesyltransferase [Candidatus Omnitrophota bacterium]
MRFNDYFELTKPRLTALVVVTTAAGWWVALRSVEFAAQALPVLITTALVVGGANALNQWAEHAQDALMRRTKNRPIPSGRLTPIQAYRFGLGLSVIGFIGMLLLVNGLSTIIALISWAIYVLVYTPLKRQTPLCTLVGAIPGALPTLIGWTASGRSLAVEAAALFAILFVWQLPHFLALAVLYRDDYARAGFRMLTVMQPEGDVTARQMAWYAAVLVPLSLLPAMMGLAGSSYFYGALVLSGCLCAAALRTAVRSSQAAARQLFHASIAYLPLLLALLAVSRPPAAAAWW